MERTSIPEPPGFNNLSEAEQIQYSQALGDHTSENPSEVPVPESHIELAEQRLAEYRRDPKKAHPAHEVLDRLG